MLDYLDAPLLPAAVHSPHVNGSGVDCRAEQHVRGPVPQRHHFVTVRLGGHRLGARQTKVGQLQFAQLVDEQVLWFQVAVQDPVLVAVGQAAQQLKQEQLPGGGSVRRGETG